MTSEKPRWIYRFDNYNRAFSLLREAIETLETRPLSQLEKEGIIQRFEYTWELAWKTLRDYLEYKGIILDTITPSSVIKAAYAAKIISSGDAWMQAMEDRNKMSHTYDIKVFEKIITDIQKHHFLLFERLHADFLKYAPDGKADA